MNDECLSYQIIGVDFLGILTKTQKILYNVSDKIPKKVNNIILLSYIHHPYLRNVLLCISKKADVTELISAEEERGSIGYPPPDLQNSSPDLARIRFLLQI